MRAVAQFLLASLLGLTLTTLAAAQGEGLSREEHPWGRFPVGSWKQVLTTTETLDAHGNVIDVTKTYTTTKLVDVDDRGYTLRIDVVMDVSGKRITAQPQAIRRGFHGEAEGQTVSVRQIGQERLTVAGRKVPCEVREIVVRSGRTRRVTTVHYSPRFEPHVLRREVTTLDPTGTAETQCEVEVVAVDVPVGIRNEVGEEVTVNTTRLQVRQQRGDSSILTVEVHAPNVPGGVVKHTSKETDAAGRVVRRSELSLVDYGLGSGRDADTQVLRRAFHRGNRNRRAR